MITAPCKDCKKRELGCHSKCEEYLNFRVEKENEYKEKNRIENIERPTYGVVRVINYMNKRKMNTKKM